MKSPKMMCHLWG